jgi:Enolase C-terminal domain-like
VKHTEKLLQSLRDAAGDEMDILLDFHGRPFSSRAALTYIDAYSPARPMFVEEPTQPGDPGAMAQIAQLAKCPIATGERLITHREYEDLCGLCAVTYVQPDVCHCGGFTVGKQIAATAATFGIGFCQRANDNRHGPWIPFGRWGQAMRVSDRDLCRAFEHPIKDERVSFGVYNLVSRNPGMRWEIASLARDLGFVPQDGETMRLPVMQTAKAGLAWVRDVGLRNAGDGLAGQRW